MGRRVMHLAMFVIPLVIGIALGLAASSMVGGPESSAEAARPKLLRSASAEIPSAKAPVRYGSVIGVKPEKLDEYCKLHAAVWPDILAMIKKCNIRNYSIYLGTLDDGNLYLFSYFEYVGDDFKADMKKMADDPRTQEWWKHTDPCQIPQ